MKQLTFALLIAPAKASENYTQRRYLHVGMRAVAARVRQKFGFLRVSLWKYCRLKIKTPQS
jgi:hypothetical protein